MTETIEKKTTKNVKPKESAEDTKKNTESLLRIALKDHSPKNTEMRIYPTYDNNFRVNWLSIPTEMFQAREFVKCLFVRFDNNELKIDERQ